MYINIIYCILKNTNVNSYQGPAKTNSDRTVLHLFAPSSVLILVNRLWLAVVPVMMEFSREAYNFGTSSKSSGRLHCFWLFQFFFTALPSSSILLAVHEDKTNDTITTSTYMTVKVTK